LPLAIRGTNIKKKSTLASFTRAPGRIPLEGKQGYFP
jgi:hypothetical protein